MSYMKFIMIGLLLREALDRLRVRLNMYLVKVEFKRVELLMEDIYCIFLYINFSWHLSFCLLIIVTLTWQSMFNCSEACCGDYSTKLRRWNQSCWTVRRQRFLTGI